MIFATENAIPDIIARKKTQTRRLVKENHLADNEIEGFEKNPVHCVFTIGLSSVQKKKWYVGQEIAVQPGRGKPCVRYCPKCKEIEFSVKRAKKYKPGYGHELKPLRIRIRAIRKEKLLDISNRDARKEGFKDKAYFLHAFYSANKRYAPKDKALFIMEPVIPDSKIVSLRDVKKAFRQVTDSREAWNPDVWVINFEVVR